MLGMPPIVLPGLFTTQILGVSLEQLVLYSMSSGNLTNMVSQTNATVMRLRLMSKKFRTCLPLVKSVTLASLHSIF